MKAVDKQIQGAHTQKGMVLITGMIFLLIISLACVSTLHNLGIFSQSHADAIAHQQQRYVFESTLEAIERLLEQQLQTHSIEQQQVLWYSSLSTKLALPEQLYAQDGAFKSWQGFEYCVEFVGETVQPDEQGVTTRVLRLTVIQAGMPHYALQSWLVVVPSQQGAAFRFYRAAWYEYFSEGV